MQTAQKLFTDTVYDLPPAERFRLACLILDELARSGGLPAVADSSDIWSEGDQEELAAFSLSYGAAVYPEDEEHVAPVQPSGRCWSSLRARLDQCLRLRQERAGSRRAWLAGSV